MLFEGDPNGCCNEHPAWRNFTDLELADEAELRGDHLAKSLANRLVGSIMNAEELAAKLDEYRDGTQPDVDAANAKLSDLQSEVDGFKIANKTLNARLSNLEEQHKKALLELSELKKRAADAPAHW